MIRKKIKEEVKRAIRICEEKGIFSPLGNLEPQIEIPREKTHGDYSTNVAFFLSKDLKRSPKEIAETLCGFIDLSYLCKDVESVSGFINFRIREDILRENFKEIYIRGIDAFLPDFGKGKRALVEFVSANPTGPLHIGHGRNAAFGDSLANILKVCGFEVTKEYYVNDMGKQIHDLGESVYLRLKELRGEQVTFKDHLYQGDYVKDLAKKVEEDRISLPENEEEAIRVLGEMASSAIMEDIIRDLEKFGCFFDSFYRESDLYRRGCVEKAIQLLKENGFAYEKDGAIFFKTALFEADEDRVLVKSDGEKTYFASDIAYHKDKFERGFDLIIDIWGSDHHGYIPRIRASVEALGNDKEKLKILLIQFVTLLRDGKPLGMSTRKGEFTTLKELLSEVGKDAARFFFLTRKGNAHLEFDIDLAKRASNENPVFYVQYAHARIESVFRFSEEVGIFYEREAEKDVNLLSSEEEIDIIKGIIDFFDVLEGSAKSLEPHRITFYLLDLAQRFHSYYNKTRILQEDKDLALSRLMLLDVLREIIKRGLNILGVSAPERM